MELFLGCLSVCILLCCFMSCLLRFFCFIYVFYGVYLGGVPVFSDVVLFFVDTPRVLCGDSQNECFTRFFRVTGCKS